MKTFSLFAIGFILCLCGCQSPQSVEDYQIISLPIDYVRGYGSFEVSFTREGTGKMSPNHPWYHTQVEVKGKPSGWEDTHPQQIWFDAEQFAYQNYLEGKIDSARYADLVESWEIDLAKRPLSQAPLRCFTHVIFRMLEDSTVQYMLDTNNNRDFSDDSIHVAEPLDFKVDFDSLAQYAHLTEAELFVKGQIIQRQVPIFIRKRFSNGRLYLYYNFADHYEARFKDQLLQLATSTSITLDYSKLLLGKPTRDLAPKPTEKNEFLRIKDEVFLFLGADTYTQAIQLQKMPEDTILFSTQIGFPAKPIQGVTFRTQDTIKLENYRGKYVFLDFWGSWCQPCVQEMPNVRAAFEDVDTSQVAFIGIVQDNET
ncbi:MAG: TlpA disulfide reductase family protein, partial [Bacteroidota bacterium]